MSGAPQDIPEFAARFEAPEPRVRLGAGVVVGAVLAALASGALAWWLSGDDRGQMLNAGDHPHAEVAGVQPVVTPAAATADPAQVRRAYDEVRTVYADGGGQALADTSRECAETLSADRRILDYCLAFDMYAQTMAPSEGEAAQWFQVGEARRLRLAREALPQGADPQARLAEISRLMREPATASPAEAATVAQQAAPTAKAPVAVAPPVKRVSAPAPAKKAQPASRCRFAPTPAERLICANPTLQAADRRMKRAYSQALAAGADRQIIEGEQAAWRVARNAASDRREMAALYARRMRELEQHVAQAN